MVRSQVADQLYRKGGLRNIEIFVLEVVDDFLISEALKEQDHFLHELSK